MSNLYCSLSYQSSCNDRDLCLSSHSKVLRTRLVITLYHDIFQPVRRKTQCKGLQKIFRKKSFSNFPCFIVRGCLGGYGDLQCKVEKAEP